MVRSKDGNDAVSRGVADLCATAAAPCRSTTANPIAATANTVPATEAQIYTLREGLYFGQSFPDDAVDYVRVAAFKTALLRAAWDAFRGGKGAHLRGDFETYREADHRDLHPVAPFITFEDRLVARHVRCWGRERSIFDPVHYLALLERKPGGFDFAQPLAGWDLPACFDVLRRRLEAAAADGHGTRAFIRVLRLLETHSLSQLADAVAYALDRGVIDPDSIRVVLDHRADRPVELRLDPLRSDLDRRRHVGRQ